MMPSANALFAPILQVDDLGVQFRRPDDCIVRAVDGVGMTVGEGEVVAIVGESGCGKTTTALAIMRLIRPPGLISNGRIFFKGRDILTLSPRDLRGVLGREIAIVFQNPNTYLNPVMKVGEQIAESAMLHLGIGRRQARALAIETLAKVRVSAPERVAASYPHELSGGMNQRVLISIALICEPALIILDEPTTALDVTVQREIINLLRDMKSRIGNSMIFITHDFALVAELADRVYVMYGGKVIEQGKVYDIFYRPQHPYTRALLGSVLSIGTHKDRLPTIEGAVPDLAHPVIGCAFRPRCEVSLPKCAAEEPFLAKSSSHQAAACWLAES